MLIVILFTVFMLHYVGSEIDDIKGKDMFDKFKNLYKKKYPNQYIEREAYINFIRNVNEVNKLNENTEHCKKIGERKYNLNRFADQDPEELINRYGVTIKPYDYASNEMAREKNYLRNQKQKNMEDLNLYDLDSTESLYAKYMEQFDKINASRMSTRDIHYYRFYKTLVELNNKKIEGQNVAWDADSDKVKRPHEYYFDDE